MHHAAAAFGVFVRRQIGDNQAAQRVGTAVRRWRMITG